MNCLCNLFDDNGTLWIIVIALIILFCRSRPFRRSRDRKSVV